MQWITTTTNQDPVCKIANKRNQSNCRLHIFKHKQPIRTQYAMNITTNQEAGDSLLWWIYSETILQYLQEGITIYMALISIISLHVNTFYISCQYCIKRFCTNIAASKINLLVTNGCFPNKKELSYDHKTMSEKVNTSVGRITIMWPTDLLQNI